MHSFLKILYDWLEVWALFFPIYAFLKNRGQPHYMIPVGFYLLIALILYVFSDVIWQRTTLGIDLGITNNNPLYNLNSIVRFLLFSTFFIRLAQPSLMAVKKTLPFLFIAFVLFNFIFLEDYFRLRLSSKLHVVESGLLLFYCLHYYFYLLAQDQSSFTKLPSFWVVTGLSILVVASFSIYLFYDAMIDSNFHFAVNIWQFHKIAFLIFCLFLTKAFYVGKR